MPYRVERLSNATLTLERRLLSLFAVALLAGCDAEMTAPEGSFRIDLGSRTAVEEGEVMARSCASREELEITGEPRRFSLWIVPGASMDTEGNSSPDRSLPNAGVTDFNARRIYIVEAFAGARRAWAHEFLHVLTGSRDHPPFFARCGLSRVRPGG